MTSDNDAGWPGHEYGLPESGPGSMAPLGRRVLALFIDWALVMVFGTVLAGSFGGSAQAADQLGGLLALVLFVLMHLTMVSFLGITVGKRIVRIQVVRGTQAPGIGPVALRTGLLLLVIPAILSGPDGRALHDKAAGTFQLRM
ncbi:RDD family protein [Nesterenkonia lacusekhoensis]|uniref:RDD family membrane protein YckC n=1 Tax=Nesterenkonia lacusekhoensis TaxID=150832 RepID=A0ABS4T0H8_9MICC|nr:RDD family protein [Nesterenkonia lacusekhoensis]MBP2317959.1 putative RDD family membrane protein YckC [Nesterenkonia lacusekhoensis]